MSNEINVIVVAVMPNHPAGRRNRAGITFTTEAVAYEVTAEQEKEIRADQYLRVIEKGTALADAMKRYEDKKDRLSAPVESEGPVAPVASSEQPEATIVPPAPIIPETSTPAPEGNDLPPATPAPTPVVAPVENAEVEIPIARMNKETLVKKLTEKGLVAWKDFQPDAKNKDLQNLLASL